MQLQAAVDSSGTARRPATDGEHQVRALDRDPRRIPGRSPAKLARRAWPVIWTSPLIGRVIDHALGRDDHPVADVDRRWPRRSAQRPQRQPDGSATRALTSSTSMRTDSRRRSGSPPTGRSRAISATGRRRPSRCSAWPRSHSQPRHQPMAPSAGTTKRRQRDRDAGGLRDGAATLWVAEQAAPVGNSDERRKARTQAERPLAVRIWIADVAARVPVHRAKNGRVPWRRRAFCIYSVHHRGT